MRTLIIIIQTLMVSFIYGFVGVKKIADNKFDYLLPIALAAVFVYLFWSAPITIGNIFMNIFIFCGIVFVVAYVGPYFESLLKKVWVKDREE